MFFFNTSVWPAHPGCLNRESPFSQELKVANSVSFFFGISHQLRAIRKPLDEVGTYP